MSDLTDADLEAMEKRYEAALKALYRADELIDPSCWGYDQIEAVQDLAADLSAPSLRCGCLGLVGDLAQCQIITDAFDGYDWPDVPVELVERAEKLMGHFRGES